jgi:hypothetical protein
MQYFLLALQAIPVLLQLVLSFESMFPGKGQGTVKKEGVMQGVNGALALAVQAGAKITPEEQAAISTGLGKAVDSTVTFFNSNGWPKATEGPDVA